MLCLPGEKYKDLVFLRKTITCVQFHEKLSRSKTKRKQVMCDMETCKDCYNLDFLRCKDPSGNAGPLFACRVIEEAPTRKLPSRKKKASTATDIPVGFDKTVLVISDLLTLTMLSVVSNAGELVVLVTKYAEPPREITLHFENVIFMKPLLQTSATSR